MSSLSSHTSQDPVVAAALDAVVSMDANGRLLDLNPAAEAMFGYARDDAMHRPVAELVVPPRHRARHRSAVRRLAAGGEPSILGSRIEVSAMYADGREFPVELTVTRTGEDPVVYTAWIRDVSESKGAAELSIRRKSLLEHAERQAGIGSWSWRPATGEVMWSENLFRIYGLEPDSVRPSVERLLELTHPDDRERVAATLQVTTEGRRLPRLDLRVVWPDGTVRHLRAIAADETGGEGADRELVGCVQDMTDQRLAEREIAAHVAVSDALAEWGDIDDGAQRLLRSLGTTLDCQFGTLWVPDDGFLTPRVFWSEPSARSGELRRETCALRLPRGVDLPGRAWQHREPVARSGRGIHEGLVRERAAEAAGVCATVAFPAISGDEVLAVVELHSTEPIELGGRLLRSLTGIGYDLGGFLQRRRGELKRPALTTRQLEILQLAAGGLSGPEIAERLFVSPATVKTHFQNIYEKLEVPDRPSAVAHAMREGLID
jgi:PAS domain S-box-containing protein